jgi:tRNA 2-thiouridine synthesizing protein A
MMTTEELKKLKPDKVVDARGTACPGPLLAVNRPLLMFLMAELWKSCHRTKEQKKMFPDGLIKGVIYTWVILKNRDISLFI